MNYIHSYTIIFSDSSPFKKYRFFLSTILILAIVAAIYPFDGVILDRIQTQNQNWNSLAKWISVYGQFEYSTLALSVLFFTWGKWTSNDVFKKAGKAVLLAGIISGLMVTVLRPGLGRARPTAEAITGFHYLELNHHFHSFPSGHVSTTAASAMALAAYYPPFRPVAVISTGLMAWSRMQLNKHYLSDVIAGWALGVGCAFVSVRAMKRDAIRFKHRSIRLQSPLTKSRL